MTNKKHIWTQRKGAAISGDASIESLLAESECRVVWCLWKFSRVKLVNPVGNLGKVMVSIEIDLFGERNLDRLVMVALDSDSRQEKLTDQFLAAYLL